MRRGIVVYHDEDAALAGSRPQNAIWKCGTMIDVPQSGQSTSVMAALRTGRGICAAYMPPRSRRNADTFVWPFPQVLSDRAATDVIPALNAQV